MAGVPDIVNALKQCRLLEPVQLDALLHELRQRPLEPRALAKQLIGRDWLTPFQANQLLKGRASDLLLGSYVLIERLGEGGMGTVYKARNWKLGQTVAVKLIRPERLKSDNGVRRFQREIRLAAQLDHPSIVRALDADDVGGVQLLVMEYVPGGIDLYRLVKQRGPLTIADACHAMRQAALGLQHAFERGLVHRDIKPHNLLVDTCAGAAAVSIGAAGLGVAYNLPAANGKAQASKTPASKTPATKAPASQPSEGSSSNHDEPRATIQQVKIVDFGLARREDDSGESSSTLTQEGSVMGTLDYIAPEQATDSHAADIRADLYSLGCTFYYLLAGRPPFPGGEALAKLMKHRFDPAPPIRALRPDAAPALEQVILKLMAKRPEDRYQTPAEFLVALSSAEEGGVSTQAAPAVEHVGTPLAAETETVADHWRDIVSDSGTKQISALRLPAAPTRLPPAWRYGGAGVAVVIMALCLWRPWSGGSDPSPKVPPAESMVQDTVFLTEMQEHNVETHPNHKLTKGGKASNGGDLLADGRHTPNGIYMVPPSRGRAQAQYLLARQFTTFKSGVALCDGASADPGVVFKLIGDGRVLWKSEPINKPGEVQHCEAPVKGMRQLDLVVECPGDASNAGAIWIEPALETITHAVSRPLVLQGRANQSAK